MLSHKSLILLTIAALGLANKALALECVKGKDLDVLLHDEGYGIQQLPRLHFIPKELFLQASSAFLSPMPMLGTHFMTMQPTL